MKKNFGFQGVVFKVPAYSLANKTVVKKPLSFLRFSNSPEKPKVTKIYNFQYWLHTDSVFVKNLHAQAVP